MNAELTQILNFTLKIYAQIKGAKLMENLIRGDILE
jgi:hypothetical protein